MKRVKQKNRQEAKEPQAIGHRPTLSLRSSLDPAHVQAQRNHDGSGKLIGVRSTLIFNLWLTKLMLI
jgi:hypothetical protein